VLLAFELFQRVPLAWPCRYIVPVEAARAVASKVSRARLLVHVSEASYSCHMLPCTCVPTRMAHAAMLPVMRPDLHSALPHCSLPLQHCHAAFHATMPPLCPPTCPFSDPLPAAAGRQPGHSVRLGGPLSQPGRPAVPGHPRPHRSGDKCLHLVRCAYLASAVPGSQVLFLEVLQK